MKKIANQIKQKGHKLFSLDSNKKVEEVTLEKGEEGRYKVVYDPAKDYKQALNLKNAIKHFTKAGLLMLLLTGCVRTTTIKVEHSKGVDKVYKGKMEMFPGGGLSYKRKKMFGRVEDVIRKEYEAIIIEKAGED